MQFVQDGRLAGGVQPQHHNLQCNQAASPAVSVHRLYCEGVKLQAARGCPRASGGAAHLYCISLARMSLVPHILSKSFFREFPMAAKRMRDACATGDVI